MSFLGGFYAWNRRAPSTGDSQDNISRRKWTTTTMRDAAASVAPDLVKRDFAALNYVLDKAFIKT